MWAAAKNYALMTAMGMIAILCGVTAYQRHQLQDVGVKLEQATGTLEPVRKSIEASADADRELQDNGADASLCKYGWMKGCVARIAHPDTLMGAAREDAPPPPENRNFVQETVPPDRGPRPQALEPQSHPDGEVLIGAVDIPHKDETLPPITQAPSDWFATSAPVPRPAPKKRKTGKPAVPCEPDVGSIHPIPPACANKVNLRGGLW